MFSHLLLVACICIVIALILYFFFWNRFIGFLLGQAIRFMYWNQEASSIWVEIGSIHFSLLAGRILLKDVRYHSSNQTIKIVKGQLQWRYWIRRPTTDEDIGAPHEGEDLKQDRTLSCRIQVSFQGFEWFLYNRTAAYDNIVAQMEGKTASRPTSRATDRRQFPQKSSRAAVLSLPFYPPSLAPGSIRVPLVIRNAMAWVRRQLPSLDPKDLLPIGIEITKGAIICGNSSTPNMLVAEFRRTEGTFGIVQPKSKYDLYREILALKFQHALIRYVPNEEYVDSMPAMGEFTDSHINHFTPLGRASSYLSYRSFAKLWQQLKLYAYIGKYRGSHLNRSTFQPRRNRNQSSGRAHKKSKKVTDDEVSNDHASEYAMECKLLEAPVLELSYYADAVGDVPMMQHITEDISIGNAIGNGDVSPDWGLDLIIKSGFLRYGPWADRQRAELQKAFFPPTYHDVEVTPHLKPGDKRMWTAARIFIELRDDTTLHIPFREASKNWQWDGKSEVPLRSRAREPASIHLRAGDRSSINYIMPMIAGPAGYDSVLDVHLEDLVVTSSLNDIRLVTAKSCKIHCDLPSPLKWNEERKWTTTVSMDQPVLYLIRDHINMFTDLGKDWTAGPLSDYHRFVPMIYSFEVALHDFELNLYANDHNIIDKPLIRDENALLTMRGVIFKSQLQIPSNVFRAEVTIIPFFFEALDISINLSLPRWNIHSLHAPKEGNSLGKAGYFRVEGSYQYFAEVREEYIEQLKLTFTTRDVAYKALGWSIRYFMVLRDNYLGSFTHFSTLYEYLDKRRRGLPAGDPIALKYRDGKANVLQVEMYISVERATTILPVGLPGYETSGVCQHGDYGSSIGACIIIDAPEIQLQFRMQDYYMEMSLNIGPSSACIDFDFPEKVTYGIARHQNLKKIIVIDGIDITANRLFGPQPRTATYVCIWEIRLGHIRAFLSALDVKLFAAAGDSFRVNFADFPNAPATEYLPPVDPDVTFFKFSLAALDATWRAGDAALVLSLLHGLKLDMNDIGGRYHRKITSLRLPHISCKVLLTTSEHKPWLEAAELVTDIHLDIYSSPPGWRKASSAQIAFIEEQDRITGRARQMLSSFQRRGRSHSGRILHKNGIYLPQPILSGLIGHRKLTSHPVRQRSERAPRPWGLDNLSESDGEEGVSEADRDARLARTRSSTPITRQRSDEDQNMSSGDESDNEDLTDGHSSDSDWSIFADSPQPGPQSLIMLYSYITRHYLARHLEAPELWDDAPFLLTRERISLGSSHPDLGGDSFLPQSNTQPHFGPNCVSSETQDTTIIRLECQKTVTINVTPLIVYAAAQFVEDADKNVISPEVCVDSLMSSYLSGISGPETSGSCTVVDARLPLIVIHIFQHIAMADDGRPNISPEFDEDHRLLNDDVMTLLKCSVDGIVVAGTLTEREKTFGAGFDRLALVLDTSTNQGITPTLSLNKAILVCCLYNIKITSMRENLNIIWGEVATQIDHLGPEYITATGLALAHNLNRLAILYKKWKDSSSAVTQNIIFSILQFSQNKAIIDPLSTIQPSYLIQSGTPHKLRTDTTFKFLFHLRNRLRHLDDAERAAFRLRLYKTEPVGLHDVTPLLESCLTVLDQDAYNDTYLSSLESVIPALRKSNLPPTLPLFGPSFKVSLSVMKVAIIILDPIGRSTSNFITTRFQSSASIRAYGVIRSPTYPLSMSQTSLRDKGPQSVRSISASISLGDISLSVLPHLMQFAQHVLRVRRHYNAALGSGIRHSPLDPLEIPVPDFELTKVDVTMSLRHLRIQAAAENLIFEIGGSGAQMVSSILIQSQTRRNLSMNHSLLFDKVFLRARSPADTSKESDQDILASLEFTAGRVSSVSYHERPPKLAMRTVFSIGGLSFSVPRSALRLYRFIEEWRADFLPGIEATAKALLAELQRAPTKTLSPTSSHSSSYPIFQVHGQVKYFGVSLQVMHGTWLSWEVNETIAHLNSSSTTGLEPTLNFGFQMVSMNLSVSSNPNVHDAAPSTRVKLVLPTLSLSGYHDGSFIHTIVLIDFIELKVKPSHWDTLLIVQQKFGQDFNDLIQLVQDTHVKQPTTTHYPPAVKQAIKYRGFFKIRGFRVGLEGISSTVYLECLDIGGGVNNVADRAWYISLSDVALSLAPRATGGPHNSVFNRNHRSAFVIIDYKVSTGSRNCETSSNELLQVSVTKIHAVMQPSSIGEVGDFIDHLQADMLNRKEQRALELAAFKEKAQSILKTFDSRTRDVQHINEVEDKPSWLNKYTIDLLIRNIGVAFPLTLNQDLEIPQTGSRDSTAVRAFLFSIKSIEFGAHRGETGQVTMKSLSFQFIPRFRQSVSSDFLGENHQTRNRLTYPEMKAQLRFARSGISRNIWMNANVSGFILDLDSTIPDYVFSLIDVYRQGKDRVERLSANVSRPSSVVQSPARSTASQEESRTTVPTSNIFASLTFFSGKVRVYSGSASNLYRTRSFSHTVQEPSDDQVLELGAEVFNLPVVSVWAEYRAAPPSHATGRDLEPSVLMFKSTVHSSQNTLRPTLLPFLTELVNHVETRLRKVSLQTPTQAVQNLNIPNVLSPRSDDGLGSTSSMRISFGLRIDQSKLELTCQPDVNVIAGLHWDSGGFVVNVSPGARKVTFTGSVGGLTVGLKHGFLSEDCVKLDARNLAFSVSFAKMESNSGTSIGSVSVVLDTEFLGGVRFSRLQDILCFKAVWLDRIPIFNGQSIAGNKTPSKSISNSPVNTRPSEFTTVILVRIRQIKLDVDLGQSISAITLDLKQAVLRTKLTEVLNEVSVFVGDVAIVAKGNVAGHANVSNCVFQTIRRTGSSSLDNFGKSQMLELRMTSGALVASLESDHQKLLHYHAEPLEVEIFDDWSMIPSEVQLQDRPLQLSFTVTSPEIIAVVTIGAVPKLLSYVNKFKANLDVQRQGASRESKTFRVTRTPKPDNPLSAVAEAMLNSARTRFKEAETGLSYVIKQHMSFRLRSLRLAVFPRTMDDVEMAQFIGQDVRARLDRVVGSETTPATRDLHLSFSSMTISKFTRLGHTVPVTDAVVDGRGWLMSLLKDASEAIIVGLPSMTMHMISKEILEDVVTNLVYDFHSKFIRREGRKDFEDIYITLNVSLYSWLTVLRKTLTREMYQVRAAAGVRSALNMGAVVAGPSRKKVLELSIPVDSRSSTIHSVPSPLSPLPSVEQTELTSLAHPPYSALSPSSDQSPTPVPFPASKEPVDAVPPTKQPAIIYTPQSRHIERLTMRQLGEATPDVMHPFFMKKAGFNLEDSLPQYVNEYATTPLEEIMEVLLNLYSRQLLAGNTFN